MLSVANFGSSVAAAMLRLLIGWEKGLTMANLINKILEDKDEKTKQQLELLLLSARSKLQQFKMAINEGYLNPEAQQKLEVIGKRSIEWGEEYRVNISSGVDKAIDDILTSFFHGTDESLKTGFKTMINVAIKTILGDASPHFSQQRSVSSSATIGRVQADLG